MNPQSRSTSVDWYAAQTAAAANHRPIKRLSSNQPQTKYPAAASAVPKLAAELTPKVAKSRSAFLNPTPTPPRKFASNSRCAMPVAAVCEPLQSSAQSGGGKSSQLTLKVPLILAPRVL